MPLAQRVLNVILELPSGNVTLDASLDLHVHIKKDALAIQNSCTIDVFGLSQSVREAILSQFTAWNKRQIETGNAQPNYVNMYVQAGYLSDNKDTTTIVFSGQVVLVNPISAPPNIGVRITCYSQQLQKLQWVTGTAPASMPFKQYVEWAGAQMGVSSIDCKTSYDDTVVWNPSGTTEVVAHLLIDIQSYYRPNVVAFIDNNILYVRDANKVIDTAQKVTISEFIGTPMWTEWGVEFTTLYNPQLQLAGAPTLNSKMNPSLNKTYVTTSLEYDLTSRDVAFYVRVNASPSA